MLQKLQLIPQNLKVNPVEINDAEERLHRVTLLSWELSTRRIICKNVELCSEVNPCSLYTLLYYLNMQMMQFNSSSLNKSNKYLKVSDYIVLFNFIYLFILHNTNFDGMNLMFLSVFSIKTNDTKCLGCSLHHGNQTCGFQHIFCDRLSTCDKVSTTLKVKSRTWCILFIFPQCMHF